jgi:hypothetical protein
LSADTVDHNEQAAPFVNVEAIFVDFALEASIGGASGCDGIEGGHMESLASFRPHQPDLAGNYGNEGDQEDVARDEQQCHGVTTPKSRNTVSARPMRA